MEPEESTPAAATEPGPAASPAGDAAAFFRQLGEQTSQVLTAAEEAGRGIREQARRDAAGIIAEARIQANELALAAASERRVAEEELRRFREARTILANQIEDVHRRLEEIILRLRTPVDVPETVAARKGGPKEAPRPAPASAPAPELIRAEAAVEALKPSESIAPSPGDAGAPADAPAAATPPVPAGEPPPPIGEAPPPVANGSPASNGTSSYEALPLADVLALQGALPVEVVAIQEPTPALAGPFAVRAAALGDSPLLAGRSLKRLLQEDQNDLLDRIRRFRGRGTFEDEIFPAAVQVERFVEGMRPVLEPAFLAGRKAGGGLSLGEPPDVVGALVAKQVVAALRRDLGRMVEPRLAAGDTATTISERAGDVYRVWKGVRTELLGEGLVYAAFHHGMLDAWRETHGPGKRWTLSADEADCPRNTCRINAAAGVVSVDTSFPSGHLAPPAHGGCTCTVVAATE